MKPAPVRVLVETTRRKVFVSALGWPGLSRGGRTQDVAMEALLAAMPRYAKVAAAAGFAAVLGRKHTPDGAAAIAAMRADILDVFGQPSDGSPIAGRKWPPRYAARRIAWHVLDHAWEIEDRSDPG